MIATVIDIADCAPLVETLLEVPYELPAFCNHCQDERRFFVYAEIVNGRVGFCCDCGREKFFPFSRTVSEVG
jgi:hypothetical protein